LTGTTVQLKEDKSPLALFYRTPCNFIKLLLAWKILVSFFVHDARLQGEQFVY